jgi:hypothetical protein
MTVSFMVTMRRSEVDTFLVVHTDLPPSWSTRQQKKREGKERTHAPDLHPPLSSSRKREDHPSKGRELFPQRWRIDHQIQEMKASEKIPSKTGRRQDWNWKIFNQVR